MCSLNQLLWDHKVTHSRDMADDSAQPVSGCQDRKQPLPASVWHWIICHLNGAAAWPFSSTDLTAGCCETMIPLATHGWVIPIATLPWDLVTIRLYSADRSGGKITPQNIMDFPLARQLNWSTLWPNSCRIEEGRNLKGEVKQKCSFQ